MLVAERRLFTGGERRYATSAGEKFLEKHAI
jgi:hypothetical protein